MAHIDPRSILELARNQLLGTLGELDRAIASLSDTDVGASESDPPPGQISLTGKVGRPSFKIKKEIALWEAGLQISSENGEKEWINVQAWRKTAVFARDNYPSAAMATVMGKWKSESWTDDRGEHERDVFVISYFEGQEKEK